MARPSAKGPKWTKSRKELMIRSRMTLADKLTAALIHIPALCDSESQVPLIAGYVRFEESALEDKVRIWFPAKITNGFQLFL